MRPLVSPLLRQINVACYRAACRCDTQEEANLYLVEFGLTPVPIFPPARKVRETPSEVGAWGLRACQGDVDIPNSVMKKRDVPEGTTLRAIVTVTPQATVRVAGGRTQRFTNQGE